MKRPVDNPATSESVRIAGSPIASLAPHGGNIEAHTEDQAIYLADRIGADRWCFGAAGSNAFDKWHITSSEISPSQFPGYNRLLQSTYQLAVAFHGFTGSEVVIGGTCDLSFREDIAAEIEYTTAVVGEGTDSGDYAYIEGTHENNIINRLTDGRGGLQIEQPMRIRQNGSEAVADAVASVIQDQL